jgi:transcriptional regulator with XRE-family HTH domain
MEKNSEIDNRAIGQRIRQEREKFGLLRENFAEIVGLSDYHIGQLERGERQMSLPVLVKVANCFHVSLDYLIFGISADDACYISDGRNTYKAADHGKIAELSELTGRCSPKELEMVIKLLKTILPYVGKI